MFQNSINAATGVIVDRAQLVKKVSFPREILALANVGAAVVYFAIQLGVLAIFLLAVGHQPAWGYLWILPISFVALYLFTASVAMVMSAITVYLRDMKHLMEVLLMLWFWLTPVVYTYENSLAAVRSTVSPTTVLHILPTWPVSTYFYFNLALAGLMIVLFLVSVTIFGRLEGNFESEL